MSSTISMSCCFLLVAVAARNGVDRRQSSDRALLFEGLYLQQQGVDFRLQVQELNLLVSLVRTLNRIYFAGKTDRQGRRTSHFGIARDDLRPRKSGGII